MLVTKEMEKGCSLFSGELFSHEGLISETHFMKLKLLAKLVIKGYGMQIFDLNEENKSNSDLPSKFTDEDSRVLKGAFDAKTLSVLANHWKTALSDSLNLNKKEKESRIFL